VSLGDEAIASLDDNEYLVAYSDPKWEEGVEGDWFAAGGLRDGYRDEAEVTGVFDELPLESVLVVEVVEVLVEPGDVRL